MLIEQEHGEGIPIVKLDVRRMTREERKQVLDEWFNHHLHCVDGTGYGWASHCWMPKLNAWLWGPCRKCGEYRVTQVYGNYFSWHPDRNYARALVINDEIDDVDVVIRKVSM